MADQQSTTPKQVMATLYPHLDPLEAARATCGEEQEAWRHCVRLSEEIKSKKRDQALAVKRVVQLSAPPPKHMYPDEDELM